MSTAIATTGLSLEKGSKMDITKGNAGLTGVSVAAGWDAKPQGNQDVDVDVFCVQLDANGKVLNPATDDASLLKNAVFFNNQVSTDGAIVHSGDNLTGAGDGDDETIKVDLTKLDPNCDSIGFFANIFKAAEHNQVFGGVKNAFIRIYDTNNPTNELGRYDLAEESSNTSGFVLGKMYRYNGEWKFQAASMPTDGSILEILKSFV